MTTLSGWIAFCGKPVPWENDQPCVLFIGNALSCPRPGDHPGLCKAEVCGDVKVSGSFVYVCDIARDDHRHMDGHHDTLQLRGW
jgi:hypothetical protein